MSLTPNPASNVTDLVAAGQGQQTDNTVAPVVPAPAQATPTNVSEEEEEIPTVDFDSDGAWNHVKQKGPAIHTPQAIKDIVVDEYSVQWLNLSDPSENFYAKNHMVVALRFAQPFTDDGATFYNSARVSMELGEGLRSTAVVGQDDFVAGENFFVGEYTVRLFMTDELSGLVVHHLTYAVCAGAKLGDFTQAIIDRDMHHFLFLPYTTGGRWKGCGDHVIQCFVIFVQIGLLPSEDSNENPDIPLSTELMYTYIPGGKRTHARIGRGWWLKYNPPITALAPEDIFSEGRLTWQIPIEVIQRALAEEAAAHGQGSNVGANAV